jgi:hypothetical protein
VAHANARLTPAGRAVLCQRIASGRPVAQVAAEMGISRPCAYRWWWRYAQAGPAGLVDRPSCAHRHPRRTSAQLEAQVVELRQAHKLGPARIGPLVGLPASTVYRVLCRHRRNRLAMLDRPTGQPIRRYERAHPGELVHMDIKKLGRLRDGGATGSGPRLSPAPQRPSPRRPAGRLRLHPRRRRRPLPPGLRRSPRR